MKFLGKFIEDVGEKEEVNYLNLLKVDMMECMYRVIMVDKILVCGS